MVIPGEYLLFLALIFLHFPIQFETAKRGLEQLKKLIAAIGFDPMSFELWAQHASSAPSRFMVGVLIWLFTTSRSRVSSYLLLLWFAVRDLVTTKHGLFILMPLIITWKGRREELYLSFPLLVPFSGVYLSLIHISEPTRPY